MDTELNSTGELQAAALGAHLGGRMCGIYTSYLKRAIRTGDLVALSTPGAQRHSPSAYLDEIDFGDLDGAPDAKNNIAKTFEQWGAGQWGAKVGGNEVGMEGESGEDVRQRVRNSLLMFAEAARQEHHCSQVAVSHSAFIRVFISEACNIPLALALSLDLRNGGVSVVDVPSDLSRPASLRAVNDVSFLGAPLVHRRQPALICILQGAAAKAAIFYSECQQPIL